jgi:hypothetical protein
LPRPLIFLCCIDRNFKSQFLNIAVFTSVAGFKPWVTCYFEGWKQFEQFRFYLHVLSVSPQRFNELYPFKTVLDSFGNTTIITLYSIPFPTTRLACLREAGLRFYKRTMIIFIESDPMGIVFLPETFKLFTLCYDSHCKLALTISEITVFQ